MRVPLTSAVIDDHGGIEVHVHVPWLPGLGCSGHDASPFDGPLLSHFVFLLHLYLMIISNSDQKIDDPKPEPREGPPGGTEQTLTRMS